MRVVNLASRPFVNRRPIVRAAGLLWAVGALLLIWNVRLFYSHGTRSEEMRTEVARLDQEIAEQERLIEARREEVRRIDLGAENRRADYLNSLIAYRTFPWSALFEDLEEVLPADVRLDGVQPDILLVPETSSRRASRTARRRSAEGTAASRNADDADGADDGERTADPRDAEPLRSGEVILELRGYAKNQEVLYEFVDRLYKSPFRNPFLRGEALDRTQGPQASGFQLSVIYLTRRPLPEPAEEPLVRVADDGTDDEADSAAVGELPGVADPAGAAAVTPPGGTLAAGEDLPVTVPGAATSPDTAMSQAPAGRAATAPDGRSVPSRSFRPTTPGSPSGQDTDRSGRDQPDPALSRPGQARPGLSRPGLSRSTTAIPGIPSAVPAPVPGDSARTPPPPRPAEPAREPGPRTRQRPDLPDRTPPERTPPDRTPPDRARQPPPPPDDDPGFRDDDASATPRRRGSQRFGPGSAQPVLPTRLELDLTYPDVLTTEGVAA